MLRDNNARPDILVTEPTVSPVTIETEVLPAIKVEEEALSRLGHHIRGSGRQILSSVAVRIPKRIRNYQGSRLASALADANDLEFALYTGYAHTSAIRHPEDGWIIGNIGDLSILVQAASVPPEIIEKAVDQLVEGVTNAAAILQELRLHHPGSLEIISRELKQHDGEQTLRMAATMLANAFVFQESLAHGPAELSGVLSIQELRSENGEIAKSAVLSQWKKILAVNYWPIFDIARRILEVIPVSTSKTLLERLSNTAEKLLESRLMRSHDLTGAVFQRLIADRKFLAAYYTTPSSAALLLSLALTSKRLLSPEEWGNGERVKSLRIADFSCGTGTLISTAYQKIGQLHELAGGDSEILHPDMMARALVACDVLPAAAHLTASMLAGSHPTVKYRNSSVLTVAYGVLDKGRVATGSLDLLDPQKKMEVLAITAKAAGGEGESEEDIWTSLPHQDFDLVVMNPPFVRATGQEADKKGVPNPMFAAFSASEDDQRKMGKALEELSKGTSAHGNAGLASYFLALADRKLRVGGVLALVMPLSLLSGEAWEESRQLLAKKYDDLILLSIAGAKDEEMSFSADTGMGECLVIARKANDGITKAGKKVSRASNRATFVILEERPTSQLQGFSVARQILRVIDDRRIRRLEDGPVGGTKISFGNKSVGQAVDSPLPEAGAWNPTRVFDISLSQSAYQLAHKRKVWLPGMKEDDLPAIYVTEIGKIGEIGPYHADIDGVTQTGGVRGPFEHLPSEEPETATYPILWSHEASRERHMAFPADCEGLVRPDAPQAKVDAVWESRSHCHFNQNFRFNSQSTAMQFTPRPSMGGRAWISIKGKSEGAEKAMVAWSNTSLGILLHWNHANKQQAGRGNVVPTSLATLPILDVDKLTGPQLKAAISVFDEMKSKALMTIDEIHRDPVRRELDEKFLTQVLHFPKWLFTEDGPIDLLRKKLAREPSVTGRGKGAEKRARPERTAAKKGKIAPNATKPVAKKTLKPPPAVSLMLF
jgi:hypothetical protein